MEKADRQSKHAERRVGRRGFLLFAGQAAVAAATGHVASSWAAEARSASAQGATAAAMKNVEKAHRELWRRFVDPKWCIIYNHADLEGNVVLPTPEECRADKPNALSWDISISDGAMFGGFYMDAAIGRWRITHQAEDRQKVRRLADGLMKLATVGQTKGFVARGLTADGSAHYALSSEDQTLPWLYGMWRYLRSEIPADKERRLIIAKIVEIAEALRGHGWKIPADRPPFDFRGSFAAMSWWGAPRLLFLLKMAADVSGDGRWEELYRQALAEKAPAGKPNRLEICAKGMVSHQPYHTWTACPGVIGLRGLWELESDRALKAEYEQGLKASAGIAEQNLPLALQFDNDDRRKFLLDWRVLNTVWREQKTVTEAVTLAQEQLRLLDSLSPRRVYEVQLMREPIFAAWVITLCPDPAIVRPHVPAILETIAHYDYERLYLSQFFPVEAAYYRLKLAGLVAE